MLKFHQEETCKGIIQRLEAREGKTRRDVRERDKGSHMASSDARVEMTFWLGDQLYALEHTGIEPFDGFMELQNTAHRLVEPFRAEIISELSALFATGVMLEMELPADAFIDRTKSQVETIHSALCHPRHFLAPLASQRQIDGRWPVGELRPRSLERPSFSARSLLSMTGGEDDQWLQLVGIFVGTSVFHGELTL